MLQENRGRIFQQRRNLPENLSSKEFRTAKGFSSSLIHGWLRLCCKSFLLEKRKHTPPCSSGFYSQKVADVWKKDVWDFQASFQTFIELQFSLGNERKDSKNLKFQTRPGTPRRPSPDIGFLYLPPAWKVLL